MTEQPKFYYINSVGDKIWYLPSKGRYYYHRVDGPAIEYTNGKKWWYINNKLHRIDGPAIADALRSKHWWIDGKHLPAKKVEKWLKENRVDLKTEAGQMAFKLRWS